MSEVTDVAYLGPAGTYSHLVAEKRYRGSCRLVPLPAIIDICRFVAGGRNRKGVVPIENSSGGAVHETVDILLANQPRLHIEAELSLHVRLALLGHPGHRVKTLFSHFMPIEHCDPWLRRHLPNAERRLVPSTAAAAAMAAADMNAAALGSRRSARMYGLTILHYPIEADVPNITVFLAISGRREPLQNCRKTTLAVKLPNRPGALCTFLEAFRDFGVNLSRLISRPLRGCPREYAFLVDIDGDVRHERVAGALARARNASAELRVVGCFPVFRPYAS